MSILRYPHFLVLATVFMVAAFKAAVFSGWLPKQTLDASFSFSREDIGKWLTELGATGQANVLHRHYYFLDLIFPLLAGLTLASLIVWLWGKIIAASPPPASRDLVALIVVAPYVLLDYAQNFAIARLLMKPDSLNASNAAWASSLNTGKWLAVAAVVLLVLALAATVAYRFASHQPGPSA